MTLERSLDVAVPGDVVAKLALLKRQADDAALRLAQGALGDRTEVIRCEQLISQIEALAYDQLTRKTVAPPGSAIITLPWPFGEGDAPLSAIPGSQAAPAEIWRSSHPRASRTDATYERLEEQLAAWADPAKDAKQGRTAICPSEIQNRALTEALRKYAGILPGGRPVDAPVTYRDGSSAAAFPLRSVTITDREPDDGREILRMTLLSVRHVEMDSDVDGAWLRNKQISLPRASGLTDQLAYEQSLQQFAIISADGPVTLYLYQTGLPPANVGFYRALVNHHRKPGMNPVAVVPHYFAGDGTYARSTTPWTIL
jgi:hypothetical protein